MHGQAVLEAVPHGLLLEPRPGIADEHAPIREVQGRDAVYRRLLALADVVSAAAALFLALWVLGDDVVKPLTLLALPLVIVVGKLKGLYERDALRLHKTTLDEAPALFQVATLFTLLVTIGGDRAFGGQLGTEQVLGLWGMLFAGAVAGRAMARRLARHLSPVERCLVIGDAESARRVARKFTEGGNVNAMMIGRLAFSLNDHSQAANALGSLDDLEEVVVMHRVHRVIVAPPAGTESDRMLETIQRAKSIGVQVSVLPRMLEVIGSSVEFDDIYGLTVMGVRRFGLTRSSAAVKRSLDVAGAGLGLLVLAPVLGLLAVAVRLTSPGGVFFRQQRIGREGRAFEMLKFRSMHAGAHAQRSSLAALNEAGDGLFKIEHDPRVTRVGRLLRKASLDELPQLLNVLRGEMSLVGPRPLVADEDARIEGRHRRRLQLKPGMTGQWQIYGSSRIPVREMVTIDYLYIANWSLWNDIKILCRTLPYMLGRRGM